MTLVGLDPYDNVIASGFSNTSNNTSDIYTAKYRKDTGTMIWEMRYNGADGFRHDNPNAMVVDAIGGAWVGGYLSSTSNIRGQLLLRYAPPGATPPPPLGEMADGLAAAPPPPAVTQAFMQIEQGDLATLVAQFADADGNDTVSFSTDMGGTPAGEVLVNAESGDFEWRYDTSRTAPGEHTVVITVTDTAGASASVNLAFTVNATLPDRTWRWQNFGSTAATGMGADDADPDGDGVSNLAEFAFGLNPTQGNSDVGIRAEAGGQQQAVGGMRAVFMRRKDYATAGLDYGVEFSSNLIDWTPSAAIPEVIADEGVLEKVGLPFPVLPNGQQGRFFRIQLQQQNAPAQ